MIYKYAPEFEKELKKLSKKWRSLPRDVSYAKARIELLYVNETPQELASFRQAFFNGKRATILQSFDGGEVVKMRLDVESIGTNDKARIVFVAITWAETITFVELFAKNEKAREDVQRVKRYLP